MTVGERIRQAREAAGMTLDELAAKSGTIRQTIYKYEHGVVTNIPLSRVQKIADALGCDPVELLGWEEEKTAETDEAVALLQQLRDEDRALLAVARNMTPEEVTVMTEFAKKMKGIK